MARRRSRANQEVIGQSHVMNVMHCCSQVGSQQHELAVHICPASMSGCQQVAQTALCQQHMQALNHISRMRAGVVQHLIL